MTCAENDVRINFNNPSVYITFERFGEDDPFFIGESRKRVWLILHNNTKWQVDVFTFSIGKESEFGLYYEVELEDKTLKGNIPIGYQRKGDHFSPSFDIESGKSILFSIPREHLSKNLMIRINFSYSWDHYKPSENTPSKPDYTVYFRSSDLPKF